MKLANKGAFDYQEYAKNMRLAMSSDEVICKDGGLNHEYFLHKKGGYWGPKEDNKLIKALGDLGVGQWDEIKTKYDFATYVSLFCF